MAPEFSFAIRSDVGLIRKNNQDSAYAGPRLLVLADGMGGPAGGDIASSIVVGTLAPLDDAPEPADKLLPSLMDGLQEAHDELVQRSEHDSKLKGLGTTCTALLRSESKLAMVHIGDSRAYLLRNQQLSQVTSDHSLVQYLLDSGQITQREAETHPKRNVVLKILGDTPGPVLADATVREAVIGDRWLLCSDGLSGVVSDETIASIMTTTEDLDQCADDLVTLALRAGGPDNITVVVADVVEAGSREPQVPEIVGAAAVSRLKPTKGTDAASGRAAALVAADPVDEDEEPAGERPKRTWRFWVAWTMIVLLVAALVGGAIAGRSWAQQQFYAQITGDEVVIYQGIPQNLGPWELSSPVEVWHVAPEELASVDRERLAEPVVRSSREELDEYLEGLEERALSRAFVPKSPVTLGGPQSDDGRSD